MKLIKKNPLLLLSLPLLVVFVSLACNMPLTQDPDGSASDRIKTAAAQTLQVQLTEISQPTATLMPGLDTPTPTATAQPSDTEAAPSPTNAQPTATSSAATNAPSPTAKAACNQAKFVKDVNIPDNTEFAPGKTFTKTWRLQNTGSCAWNPAYSLVVEGGNPLGAPASSPISGTTIQPGETVDISVEMKAPDTVGTYRTNFQLRSDTGENFGKIWTQIAVVSATGLTYDFNKQSSAATWTSGTGNNKENDLSFGGDVADPNGTATIADGIVMETKATSGKLLLTIPKRTDNGYIHGIYPEYLVQPGDRLKGRLGFMIPSGSGVCGDGKIKFEIRYRTGGDTKKLGEWTELCNGSLTPIDIDLTSLAGNKVQFILIARSVGPFKDNFAIWNSLGVFH